MIRREPASAAVVDHDLIVVGGGVYGIAVTLESARRGWRPLLLERGDFGGETSWNSLGIVHGGLRYLQSLDLSRFRESVTERRWFLRHFPDLVAPLTCLMPLYGRGLRRRSIMAMALRLDDLLSRRRNVAVRPDRAIERGRTLSSAEALELCPHLDRAGLRGAALWRDGAIADPPRLFVEMLSWAERAGARCLNYTEVVSPLVVDGRIVGVRARDRIAGETLELRSPVVVNCAGPWCREVAAELGGEPPESLGALFPPSLAFNLHLRVAAAAFSDWLSGPSPSLAVAPRGGDKAYFLRSIGDGSLLAGTFHSPWQGARPAEVPADRVDRFLDDLCRCLPGIRFAREDIIRVYWGLLPAVVDGSAVQAKRAVLRDHGASGGVAGLFSVSGAKLTTARRVAEEVLQRVARHRGVELPEIGASERPEALSVGSVEAFEEMLASAPSSAATLVREIVRREAVVQIDDLLLRRTSWGADPARREALAPRLVELLEASGDAVLDAEPIG